MATPGKQAAAEGPQNVCQVEEPQEQPIGRPVVQRDRVKERHRGGYECEFVHPPPDYFQTECSVCLQVLRDAYLAICCGHNFCNECIGRVQKAGKSCPLCNKEGFTVTYNRAYDVTLKQLEVYCTHRKIGCEWKGKLEMLDEHLNVDPELEKHHEGCAFVELQCWHDGCGQSFQRRLIAKHQSSECPQRPFSCEHCHEYETTYHDVVCNHWPVCECYPVSCPHECTQNTFQRQTLQKHLNEECPLQEVECEFRYAGCETKLPRKDMPEHVSNSKEMVRHMLLLARQNQELMAKLLEKDEQIRRMTDENQRELETKIEILAIDQQERLDRLKREKDEQIRRMADDSRREMKDEIERLAIDQQEKREGLQREKDEQIRRLAEENRRELEKAIERLEKDQDMKLDRLERKKDEQIRRLAEENRRELEKAIEILANMKLDRLERKKDEQLETLVRGQRELGQESDRQIEKLANGYKMTKRELEYQIGEVEQKQGATKAAIVKLEGQVMELQQRSETDHIKVADRIAEIESRSVTSVTEVQRRITKLENDKASTDSLEKLYHHVQIAPVQVVVTNFEQHKRDEDDWYSEGFYTHPQGYKMCLRVDANGSGAGEGTHVSCYVYLMRGEFDNHLKWPFRGNVTIQLLNQREDNKHRTETVDFNEEEPKEWNSRVTSGERAAIGWGKPTFIPLSELDHTAATNCQYLMNDCLYFRVKVELL